MLFSYVLDFMKEQEAKHYFLATDDDCDWFYQHKASPVKIRQLLSHQQRFGPDEALPISMREISRMNPCIGKICSNSFWKDTPKRLFSALMAWASVRSQNGNNSSREDLDIRYIIIILLSSLDDLQWLEG